MPFVFLSLFTLFSKTRSSPLQKLTKLMQPSERWGPTQRNIERLQRRSLQNSLRNSAKYSDSSTTPRKPQKQSDNIAIAMTKLCENSHDSTVLPQQQAIINKSSSNNNSSTVTGRTCANSDARSGSGNVNMTTRSSELIKPKLSGSSTHSDGSDLTTVTPTMSGSQRNSFHRAASSSIASNSLENPPVFDMADLNI